MNKTLLFNLLFNVFILSSKSSSTNLKYVISWSLDAFKTNFYRRNRYLFAIRITPLLFLFYLDVIRILTISCCTLLLFFFILSPFSLNLFSGLFGSRGNACAVMMTVDYLTLLHFLSFGAHLSKIVIKQIKKTFFVVIFLHYIFHQKPQSSRQSG